MGAAFLDMDTMKFLVNHVHCLNELVTSERYAHHDTESLNLFLDAVLDFAETSLYPYFREMDANPAHWDSGTIATHEQIGEVIRKGAELGLLVAPIDEQDGGLQVPFTIHTAANAILESANNHVPGYLGLTLGAAELILRFGSEALRETYLSKMLGGEWCGTMCLTEPQAGSSLSDVQTGAWPDPGGYYRIKGQKIFISGGDHQHTDNIVHLVLARISGAPAGTKGISLFVVPKRRLAEDGAMISNDVSTAGDFQKMGQRGYCTTHLMFGENDDCRGWLVGAANHGLSYMFQMMNGARIAVGRGAAAIAVAAYQASLAYARERLQGRPIENSGKKDVQAEQVPIIQHPDVRRMLYLQKVITEGSMSLVLQTAYYVDRMRMATDLEERNKYHLLLEILTPVCKTYPSEKGIEAVSNGLQVLGGYGYCDDYVLQQYYRDIRIFAIYEGTTGIQSLDLLGRKLPMQDGKAYQLLISEMQHTIREANNLQPLISYSEELNNQIKRLHSVSMHLLEYARKNEYERYLADANLYMDLFGTVVVGWQWLKMAIIAFQKQQEKAVQYSDAFYQSKIHALSWYYKYEMPRTTALAVILTNPQALTLPGPDNF
ncbi:MAG: acyl-CoA dehydrogenase [Saprospiraceae bacterium]|nr:acyl-CoA dehydrogenase [Saprospiraceae bacterium]